MRKMTTKEFVEGWNYQCSFGEPQDQETLDELYIMIVEMFRINCGLDPENIPKFKFVNDKAMIEIVEGG